MKTRKTFKVILLPTKKASDLVFDYFDQLCYKEKSLEKSEHKRHLYILSDEEIKEGDWYENNRVIFRADDNFDEGNNPNQNKNNKKIIATTDSSLTLKSECTCTESEAIYCGESKSIGKCQQLLPQLPESFIKAYIKAYNEGKPITEVDLEMKEHENPAFEYRGKPDGLYIKTRPDNTVIVHQSKMYSRDEVISLLNKCWYDSAALGGSDNDCMSIEYWIKENL